MTALRKIVDAALKSDTPLDLFSKEVMTAADIPGDMHEIYIDSLKKAIDHYEGRPNDLSPTLADIPDLNSAIVEFTNGAIDADEALWFTDTLDTMVGVHVGEVTIDEAFPEIESDDDMKTDEQGNLMKVFEDDDDSDFVQLDPEGESLYGRMVPRSEAPAPDTPGKFNREDIIQTSGIGTNQVREIVDENVNLASPNIWKMDRLQDEAMQREAALKATKAPTYDFVAAAIAEDRGND
jgi:hypothetical protein